MQPTFLTPMLTPPGAKSYDGCMVVDVDEAATPSTAPPTPHLAHPHTHYCTALPLSVGATPPTANSLGKGPLSPPRGVNAAKQIHTSGCGAASAAPHRHVLTSKWTPAFKREEVVLAQPPPSQVSCQHAAWSHRGPLTPLRKEKRAHTRAMHLIIFRP